MPTYGELFCGLKDNKKIYPKDNLYTDHVEDWVKNHIFHKLPMSESDEEALKKFSDTFKKEIRKLWKDTVGNVHYGKSSTIDGFLNKLILFFVFICKCSECTGDTDVEMEDLEEKEKRK